MCFPGPPGRDGQPLRHGDHKFEWTRAEFRAWASALAQQHGYSVEFVDIGRALQEAQALAALQQQQQQRGQEGQAACVDRDFQAAAAAGDAAEVLLSTLPSVTPAAAPAAAAAAEAVTAAVLGSSQAGSGDAAAAAAAVYEGVLSAAEQQQEQQEALIAGAVAAVSPGLQGSAAGGATPSEEQQQQESRVMQDPFQDPYQQASLGPGGDLGGASQAAVFRLLDPAAAAAAEGAAGGGQSCRGITPETVHAGSTSKGGLSAFWGPMTAVLRVGSFVDAGQSEADSSSMLAKVEVEHF